MMRRIACLLAIPGALLALPALAKPAAKPPASHSSASHAAAATNWLTQVAVTPAGSHVLGNPDAKVKLTEYMSYTCPHCAHFETEAAAPLRLGFIAPGTGSLEIRHFLRDPIDLAVALLTNCGSPRRFFVLHQAFLHAQPEWIARVDGLTEAQRQRWGAGAPGPRMRAIASDLHFYELVEPHGIDRVTADRCLSDEAMMHRISAQTEEAGKAGVDSTPSFAINGLLLTGTHDWATLQPQLAARTTP